MLAKFRRKPVYDAKRSSILKISAYQTNFQTGETISLTQKHLLMMKQNVNGDRIMQKRICSLCDNQCELNAFDGEQRLNQNRRTNNQDKRRSKQKTKKE